MTRSGRKLYFDYAATTPLDQRVWRAMQPYWRHKFGNPSSLHYWGQQALWAVDEAREKVAALIGADFREVIFTASATEANNLALRGAVRAYCAPRRRLDLPPPRVIVSAVEHKSILETAGDLDKEGVEVVYLPVDKSGRVRLDKLKSALEGNTVLVSVMYANNELGTIQPVAEIARIIADFRRTVGGARDTQSAPAPRSGGHSGGRKETFYPLFHTDAVQAFQYLECDADKLGVDLMTLSGHKIYGPKGIGVLYMRRKFRKSDFLNSVVRKSDFLTLAPIITGGGQEFGLRSGTENVPLIVGMAKAMEIAAGIRSAEFKRVTTLRNYFLRGLRRLGVRWELNSPAAGVLPGILNLFFPDFPADELLSRLDMAGIALGAGAACSSRAPEPSYVLRAAGFGERRRRRSLRLSFGRPTTKEEIDTFLRLVKNLLG